MLHIRFPVLMYLKCLLILLICSVGSSQTSDPRSGFATVEKDVPGSLTPMLGDRKVRLLFILCLLFPHHVSKYMGFYNIFLIGTWVSIILYPQNGGAHVAWMHSGLFINQCTLLNLPSLEFASCHSSFDLVWIYCPHYSGVRFRRRERRGEPLKFLFFRGTCASSKLHFNPSVVVRTISLVLKVYLPWLLVPTPQGPGFWVIRLFLFISFPFLLACWILHLALGVWILTHSCICLTWIAGDVKYTLLDKLPLKGILDLGHFFPLKEPHLIEFNFMFVF